MPILATAAAATVLNCWAVASMRFSLPVDLLYAMGEQESSLRADAIAHANDGTYSIGIMQINSSWFARLAEHGIAEDALYEPCTNIQVGAWILAQEVERYGYTWVAIGAYYAGAYTEKSLHWKLPHYRKYAQSVLDRWRRLRQRKATEPGTDETPLTPVNLESE